MSNKIFLDTNVVADLIDAKRAGHTMAMKLVEHAIDDDLHLCISEDILSTLFYISKEKAQTLAFFKNVLFVDWEILHFGKEILFEAVTRAQEENADLEDLLQCLCAKHHGCQALITNDCRFYHSGIEVLGVERFLEK